MTICFDLRALQIGHQNRGIGMYIRSVLEHMPKSEDKYVFYAFDKNDPIKELGIKLDFEYDLVQTPTLNTTLNSPKDIIGLVKIIGHKFNKLKASRPDVFIQFDFILGIPKWRRTKTIVIGYDLIPLIKKNEYLPSLMFAWQHSTGKKAKVRATARSVYYRLKYRWHYKVFKKASHIITISDAAAESFNKILQIDKHKISGIPLAPVFSTTKADESILKSIKVPYLFYVGGTDSRKRIQDIIWAFNIAKGRGFDGKLVLAGNEFTTLKHIPNIEGRNAIIDSSYKKEIYLLGFISDGQKLALYRSAYAFIFCTTYEGFGLPIIEAMSAGCPVISYNNSSIPEAAGKAAILIETGDYVAVAEAVSSLKDTGGRRAYINKGFEQIKKFNWDQYIDEFLQIIRRV